MIPRGFAHGFLVLSEEAEFAYKCDDIYNHSAEGGLAWNDPETARLRSQTPLGVAKAMAEQWG